MTHLTTSAQDGSSIAYATFSGHSNSTPLVYTNGLTTSHFYWRGLLEHFQGHTQQVVWDFKGHGASSPAQDLTKATTIQACVDDLRRVLDAANIDKAVLLAFSMGCQVVLEAWNHIPDRIAAIIPLFGTYEYPFDNLFTPALGRTLRNVFKLIPPNPLTSGFRLASLISSHPSTHPVLTRLKLTGPGVAQSDMMAFYRHLGILHPPTWQRIAIHASEHSAEDILPKISVPTLIMGGGRDTFTPLRVSQAMHKKLPESRLIPFPKATHTALFEQPQRIASLVEIFLREHDLLRDPS